MSIRGAVLREFPQFFLFRWTFRLFGADYDMNRGTLNNILQWACSVPAVTSKCLLKTPEINQHDNIVSRWDWNRDQTLQMLYYGVRRACRRTVCIFWRSTRKERRRFFRKGIEIREVGMSTKQYNNILLFVILFTVSFDAYPHRNVPSLRSTLKGTGTKLYRGVFYWSLSFKCMSEHKRLFIALYS